MEGNLLIERMLGATLHICAASDYYRAGGNLGAMKILADVRWERGTAGREWQ